MKHMTRLIEKEKAKESDNMYKILEQQKELISGALNQMRENLLDNEITVQ